MLSTVGLEQKFQGEAVNTTCFLINRSPTTALDNRIPEEIWKGKSFEYSFLRIFGCYAYVHKLDKKSTKCIFLGYVEGTKGYRLWDTVVHKIIVSRDVYFNENSMQRGKEQQGMEVIPVEVEKCDDHLDVLDEEQLDAE